MWARILGRAFGKIEHTELDGRKIGNNARETTQRINFTNDAHWKYIEKNSFPEPASHYFDHCFLSQEMGMAKPDPAIYESVLQQTGIPAKECLFLDDSKANCEAAGRLGINCINVPVRSDFREDVRTRLLQH